MAAGEPQADCLFCKILAGDIPATVVYENKDVLAFRDINPQAPVHILVIPRLHYANVGELGSAEPELTGKLLAAAAEIANAEDIVEPGYRIVFNTGAGAGQTVFHVHAHLLGGRGMQWPPG
ncbi:histidine triad nucleotide-binding protein [Yinghuangia seranimata]|uniref:histidine triad nucleotide-binding protein n=1 Tax=Yinghuangia seranimata TaxID=408067 RepID=UPI00248BC9CF|nr:histidine triad nucleotide-binding protein [Yinghuangia seranimata]MDI2127472.1 histidine triad nucleotide-binding protein [Yinghuangia seranimata]